MGIAFALAGGVVAGYLLTLQPVALMLPTHVVSDQTVGLVAANAERGSSGQLVQLVGRRSTPQFIPVSPADLQSGSGDWTADLMSGGSYIFIFLPTDDCLGTRSSAGRTALVLQHCDLQASQRWRRVGRATIAQGHFFYQYASLASRSCLTEGSELPGQVWSASLSACTAAGTTSRLVAFWWDGS